MTPVRTVQRRDKPTRRELTHTKRSVSPVVAICKGALDGYSPPVGSEIQRLIPAFRAYSCGPSASARWFAYCGAFTTT